MTLELEVCWGLMWTSASVLDGSLASPEPEGVSGLEEGPGLELGAPSPVVDCSTNSINGAVASFRPKPALYGPNTLT